MRFLALAAVQSILLSLHEGAPVVIGAPQLALDAAFALSASRGAPRLPLAAALAATDPVAAPLALLALAPWDANSSVVRAVAVDVAPQLARHRLPDPWLALAVYAALEAVDAENDGDVARWTCAALVATQLTDAPHHSAIGVGLGLVGLYRYQPVACLLACLAFAMVEREAMVGYAAQISTVMLVATEPLHSAALQLLPKIVALTQDWPDPLRNRLIEAVADSLEWADQSGGAFLKSYLELMQRAHIR